MKPDCEDNKTEPQLEKEANFILGKPLKSQTGASSDFWYFPSKKCSKGKNSIQ